MTIGEMTPTYLSCSQFLGHISVYGPWPHQINMTGTVATALSEPCPHGKSMSVQFVREAEPFRSSENGNWLRRKPRDRRWPLHTEQETEIMSQQRKLVKWAPGGKQADVYRCQDKLCRVVQAAFLLIPAHVHMCPYCYLSQWRDGHLIWGHGTKLSDAACKQASFNHTLVCRSTSSCCLISTTE